MGDRARVWGWSCHIGLRGNVMLCMRSHCGWGEMYRHVTECNGNVLLLLCCTLKERSVGGVAVVYLLKLTVPIGRLWGRFVQDDQRISVETFLLPTHNMRLQPILQQQPLPALQAPSTQPVYGGEEGFFGRCWFMLFDGGG